MEQDEEKYDMTSVGVVAVVSIVCVVLMALNLAPGEAAASPPSQDMTGKAVDYATSQVPAGGQFDIRPFDLNGDGKLDYYDYQDVLAGKVDCVKKQCDLDGDGLIDAQDARAFNLLVRRLYDYNNNGRLDRDDPKFLKEVLLGNAQCDANHVCDLDGDGFVGKADITLYTSLLYNYDNAALS